MAEKKVQKTKVQSDQLSDSDTPDEEEEPPTTAQDDVNKADTIPNALEESDDEQFNMAINDTSKD